MISKKICLIGAFSVGKTALVQQYVYSLFSDRYLSTLGVKISKKVVNIGHQDVNLVLWDLEGKDDYAGINFSYLRGGMAFFVVADGTRAETLDVALGLRARALELIGPVPYYLLINKADLEDSWEVSEEQMESLKSQGIKIFKTSAKTGIGVAAAFSAITLATLQGAG